MIIDDLVFVGRTVPETTSDGRVVVCSAGWSHDFGGLLRIYPLPPWGDPRRWDICRLMVEADRCHDSRPESFKVKTDRQDLTAVASAITKVGELPRAFQLERLDAFRADSIAELDRKRRSLGVIAPQDLDCSFEYDRDADDALLQFPGMETPRVDHGRHAFPRRPRIQFTDAHGPHDLALNEWGAYEWIRKNPGAEAQVFENLRFGDSDRESRLLVGNHLHHRNAWLVIAYLSFPKVQASLFGPPAGLVTTEAS